MTFVDEVTLKLKAGDGGNGVVRWRRMAHRPKGGPAGGDGGDGGDVRVEAVADSSVLRRYRYEKEFAAEDGEDGRDRSQHGASGNDLVLPLPVGSIIKDKKTGREVELSEVGQEETLLYGGSGGHGNEHFKSSTNQRPQEWEPGEPGEEGEFYIELQLFADAGLVGFPNAGKSTLLNTLCGTDVKTGAYPFTTLEPSLGKLYEFILADIPGLIEGAAEGKGLGHKFLRHINRTKIILHCLALDENNLEERYQAIRTELADFNENLVDKPEVIILTKADEVSSEEVEKAEKIFEEDHEQVFVVSVLNEESIKNLRDSLVKLLRKNQ